MPSAAARSRVIIAGFLHNLVDACVVMGGIVMEEH